MKQFYSKTLTKFVLIVSTMLLSLTAGAQTTLATGDIIFTGYDSTPAPGAGDSYSFVLLAPIAAGTTISFSDRGYNGSGWQAAGGTESTVSWVSGTALAIGTEVYITGLNAYSYNITTSTATANGTVTLTEGSSTNGLSLSNVGDQIIAFQGGGGSISAGGTTNIAGINYLYSGTTTDAGWNIGASYPNPSASLMPPNLAGGTSAFYTGPVSGTTLAQSGKFNCTGVPTATAANIRTAVMNKANWTLTTTSQGLLSGCTFISAAPVITAHPSNSAICAGSDTSFSITATNVTSYQWKVSTDGGTIYTNVSNTGVYTGATATMLNITGATAGMNGYKYQCVATNASGNTTSNAGTLTINPALAITGHPSNSSICAGGTTTFSVAASNTTGYQWRVNKNDGNGFVLVSNGAPYSGATTATLTITGATAVMNGYTYRVSISGSCSVGEVSNDASLTVSTAPTYTAQPANSAVCPGANTSFSATVSATNYQWTVSTDGGTIYTNITNGVIYSGATTTTLNLTGVIAGMNNYKYKLVASGTCPDAPSSVATLTVSSAPSVTGNPPNRTGCTGFNTTFPVTATGATSYQWQVSTDGGSIYTDLTNGAPYSGVTTATLTVTGATSAITGNRYRCTVSSSCGSVNSNGGLLTVSTIAIAQSQTNVTTYGGTNGTATATPSGGIPTYTYAWNPSGGSFATATGLAAGTYTVTVTDGITCQATSANYVITQPAGVGTSVSTLSAFATCSGTASASKNFTVNGGGLTADLVVTAPTGYEVSLTSGSGYGGSVSLTQTGGNVATTTIYVRMATSASGTMAGNVTVTSTGVTTKNVTVTGLASNLSASSYIVSNVSCFGGTNGTIDLTPSGGQTPYTYNWGSASTQDRINLPAGTYSVTIIDGNGCNYTVSNIVVGQPAAALSAATGGGKTDVSCNGGTNGTATVAPTGGTPSYTYSWNTTPVQTTATATGLTSGTYIVTVTDANSCQTTRSFTINQPSVLSAATGSKTDVSCNGGANGTATVTPTGGTPSYTYSWNTTPVQTTATATGLTPGTYIVTVTDANSCQATRSFTINQPAATLSTSAGTTNNTSCNGGSNGSATVNVTGGTTPYSYNWDGTPTGDGTATISGLAAGTYNVTVTDANGCQATQSFTITQPTVLVASAGAQTNVLCNGGTNGSATVSVTGGTGTYTYLWTPSGGTASTASGLAAGTYTVTVKDANLCQTTQSFTIAQPSALVATAAAQTNVNCRGDATGSATVNVTGGTGTYTYSWAPSGGTAATASGLTAATYTVTVKDANLCSTTQSFTITQPTAVLSATTATLGVSCFGGSNGAAGVTVSGGTPGYTYLWAPLGGTTATITGRPAGNYTCTITDTKGCTLVKNITINTPAAFSVTTSKTDVNCNGGTNGTAAVTVSGGTPGYTYSWSPTGGSSAIASGLAAGTYTITIQDANTCTTTASITIGQPAALSAITALTDVLCNGGATGIASVTPSGGTPGYTYVWSPSGGTAAAATGLTTGNYSVLITDANGCTLTKNFFIAQPTVLTATTAQQNATCVTPGQASVTPSGGAGSYTYLWSPSGITTQLATGLAAGNHSCLITDANGCTLTKNFTITTTNTLTATQSQTNLLCNGINTGTATVVPAGAPGPYTYVWTPSGGNAATASNLAAGTYSVTITSSNGCSITKNFTITQPAALVATAGTQTIVSCNGGSNASATVNVTGGTGAYTYVWAPTGGTAATASGLQAGTYTVTIKDANLCQTTQSFTITQPSALIASAGTQTNVSCNSGTNGAATVNVTGGTGAYTYLWAPSGGTAATASGLAAGTYTVTVKDANLCQTTQSFTITEPAVLTATPSKTDVLCNGGATGTATVVVTGGTSGYTYVWSPSGGTAATATGLSVGSYSVLITDTKGCTFTQGFTINQPAVLTATTAQQNATCVTPGQASVTPSGGAGGYTYLWSPSGATTQLATGLASGNHSCLITDANGCTLTKNFTITTTNTLTATQSQTNLLCNGINTGTATVVPAGAPGPYTYVWAPSGGNAATASNLAAGTYSVTITSSNGCSTVKNFIITEPAALVATAGTQTIVSCNGGSNASATVNVTGGTGAYTYVWAPTGGSAATASGLAAGTYTVTVKDANLCQTTQSFTITQPAAIVATAGTQTNGSCNGGTNGSATVNVTGGTGAYTYLWAPSGGTAATATGLAAGTYTVTVKDANLCQTTQSFTITEPAVLTATTAQTNVLCNGGTTGTASVTPSGGTATYTYVWSPSGGTAATASGLIAGNYSVLITDAKGCTLTKNFTITQPNALVASTGTQNNISCNGGSNGNATVNVTGGTTPYTYDWNGTPIGDGTATISALAAGTYTVTITDGNGCSTTQSFNLTQPAALAATTSQTNVSCFGASNGSASVVTTGGTGAYTYLWAPSGGTAATASGLAVGTYTVTIKDANLCQITKTITITSTQALAVTSTQTNVLCNGGANGSATVAVTGGTGTYTYSWAPSGGTAATASGLAVGTYTVTITDGNGCTTTQSFTITQPVTLVATAGTQTNVNCNSGSNGSATVNVTGGTTPYTYVWAPSGGTAATASGLLAGTYTVTVKDANLCQTTQSFTITEPAILAATTSQTNILCFGTGTGTATITASGGTVPYTYAWSPSGGNAATATGLSAGVYTYTVTDALGCSLTNTVTISGPLALTVNIAQTNVSCFGNNDGTLGVNVSGGTGPYNYAWTPAVGTGPSVTDLGVGNYSVTITDANGCSTVRNFSLTQPEQLIASITKTDVSCYGNNDGSALAAITGGMPPYTYSWTSPSGGTPDPANLVSGIYTVTVTDANGCAFTGSITIDQPLQAIITGHPQNATTTTNGNATYTVTALNISSYQWQISQDGTNWSDITDGGSNPAYSGATTNALTITGIPITQNGYQYRVVLSNGVNCVVISNAALLTLENVLEAVYDDFSTTLILAGTGGIAGDVTINDLFNNLPVNDQDIVATVIDNDGLFGAVIDDEGNLIVPSTSATGTYTITYSICETAVPGNCSTAEAIVVVSDVTGTIDFRDLKLGIYPNPATTSVFIRISDFSGYQNMKLSVHDLNGRLVKEAFITSELQNIEVMGLESGIYIFNVTADTAQASRRIIIDKKL